MPKCEYERHPIHSRHLEETLNSMAEDGWRPIHFELYRNISSYIIIFERERR